jgi:hypothetical protein
MMAVGVIFWVLIAVWFVRLGMGLDHLSKDQILGIVVGLCGGLGAWFYVPRLMKKEAVKSR